MGYFADLANDFTIYESPKSGGTTLRLWIHYLQTRDQVPDRDQTYYAGNKATLESMRKVGYVSSFFSPSTTGRNICLKRDPVARFVSCYQDKVIRENRLRRMSLDVFLDDFDRVLERDRATMNDKVTPYLKYHFAPQTMQLGTSRSYYDEIYDTSELSTRVKPVLENLWNLRLPEVHARNQAGAKLKLTEDQIHRVKEIYAIDYETGWC